MASSFSVYLDRPLPLRGDMKFNPWLTLVLLFHFSSLNPWSIMNLYYVIRCDIKTQLVNFLKDFIDLFLESGREGERERETSMCGYLLSAPYWGPGPQPRRVP